MEGDWQKRKECTSRLVGSRWPTDVDVVQDLQLSSLAWKRWLPAQPPLVSWSFPRMTEAGRIAAASLERRDHKPWKKDIVRDLIDFTAVALCSTGESLRSGSWTMPLATQFVHLSYAQLCHFGTVAGIYWCKPSFQRSVTVKYWKCQTYFPQLTYSILTNVRSVTDGEHKHSKFTIIHLTIYFVACFLSGYMHSTEAWWIHFILMQSNFRWEIIFLVKIGWGCWDVRAEKWREPTSVLSLWSRTV